MFPVRNITSIAPPAIRFARMCTGAIGDLGSGAGKGGGGGGAIRDAGGAFGKMEVAHEEEFFYKKRQEQLHMLKEKLIEKKDFHAESIKHHEEAIARHKKAIEELKKE
ncbi:ATPase inhibitor mai-2, mitochondrial-like [Wyeomyia smithii]|uniref:ATPase inhibitor mai-2, mitochondrial-like n=1 Tax=Wyeomyia smithii TaxID=174621 RepID=UPI002467B9A4|nr:ATPase inhibitor mai-2, mitochondrial-like [Wyeomyia smithii]